MICRVIELIGMARPTPTPATAVLIPTTSPEAMTKAPPELPGLSAASVWMTSSTIRTLSPARVGRERPRALTTPAVTVPARPSGLPTATTSCPTLSCDASPNEAGTGVAPSVRSTARSERGSLPTTWNGTAVPSAKAAWPASALPTTCALVSKKPSFVNTTAEPAPAATVPSRRRRDTCKAATRGVKDSATETTTWEYASSAATSGVDVPAKVSVTPTSFLQTYIITDSVIAG